MAQLGEMERQRVGGDAKAFGELPGREPRGSLAYEDPKELEAGGLGEGAEGVHGRL